MDNIINPEWINFYNNAFRNDVHQLLAWGYQDVKDEIKDDHLEEAITGFIVRSIKKRLNHPSTPQKFRRYSIYEEDYVRNTNKTGRSRQRLDIVIECSGKKPRPEFIFEAKLLRKNGFPIGKYTGVEGLQCYIRCEYADKYPAASMIGYMRSDDSNYWYDQLNDKLLLDKKKEFFLQKPLESVGINNSLPNEWISQHIRIDNTLIDIYHIFLDFTNVSSKL